MAEGREGIDEGVAMNREARIADKIAKEILLEDLFDEVKEEWSGMSKNHGLKALSVIGSGRGEGIFLADERSKKLTGVMAYELKKNMIFILEMATRKSGEGVGKEMLQILKKENRRKPIVAITEYGAGGFWLKMGFEPWKEGSHLMIWKP